MMTARFTSAKKAQLSTEDKPAFNNVALVDKVETYNFSFTVFTTKSKNFERFDKR